jgi:hypothetical protein
MRVAAGPLIPARPGQPLLWELSSVFFLYGCHSILGRWLWEEVQTRIPPTDPHDTTLKWCGRGADSNLLRFLCCAFSSQLTLDEHVVLPPFRIDLRLLRDRRKSSVGLYTRILSGYGDVELLR